LRQRFALVEDVKKASPFETSQLNPAPIKHVSSDPNAGLEDNCNLRLPEDVFAEEEADGSANQPEEGNPLHWWKMASGIGGSLTKTLRI